MVGSAPRRVPMARSGMRTVFLRTEWITAYVSYTVECLREATDLRVEFVNHIHPGINCFLGHPTGRHDLPITVESTTINIYLSFNCQCTRCDRHLQIVNVNWASRLFREDIFVKDDIECPLRAKEEALAINVLRIWEWLHSPLKYVSRNRNESFRKVLLRNLLFELPRDLS